MSDQFTLADNAAKLILARSPLRPKVGLVLGSGLGAFADSLTGATKIPYSEIPSFPQSTAIGHAGRLVIGNAGSVAVAADLATAIITIMLRVHFEKMQAGALAWRYAIA